MASQKIFNMAFSDVYPLYIKKVEKKGKSKEDVDTIIKWLTGYDNLSLESIIKEKVTFETFFNEAPKYNPNASLITGAICGYKVEEIEDPLMKKIRQLDKLIDELAKGKKIESILRK